MSFVRILCIGLGFGVGIGSSGVFYSASERLEVPDSLISAFRSRYPRLKEDELPEKNLQFHEQLKQLFLKAHKGQNRIDFRGFREMFGTDSEQFDRACFEIAKNGCDEDEISWKNVCVFAERLANAESFNGKLNEHISLLLENKHSGDISSSTSSIKAQSDVLPSSNDSNSTPLSSENSSMKLSLTSNRVEDEQEIAKDDFLHPNSTESATFRKALEDSLSAESHGAKNQLLMSHFLIHREVPAQKLRPLLLHESMALGAMSAAVAGTIIFPLDKAKTRLQSQGGSGGLFGTLRAIVMNEGWLSLFRGLGPQLVGIAPEKALKLTVNNYLRARFKDPSTGNVSVSREIFAGVLTAFIQMLITNPYEAVKIRLQLQENGKQKSALELVKSLGLKGMYRGYEWTLLRDVPFNAIYFTLYNVLKTEFIKHKSKKCGANTNLSAKELLFAGCVSGTVASAITTPADCIKTCVQSGSQEFANVGVLGAARIIYKQNGMRGFFRGVIPRILIISPLFGITFMCFETFQKWLFPDTVHAPTVIEHPEFCLKALQKFKLQRIKEQFEEK